MSTRASAAIAARAVYIESRLEHALRLVAQNTAVRVQAAAKAGVAKRTRATELAIRVVEEPKQKLFRVQVDDITGRHPMAPVWLEYGTVHTPAKPYMGPALEGQRASYLADVGDASARVLREAEAIV
jgi:hypothetical protein